MRLVNEYGNLAIYTDDKKEIKKLKEQGYTQKEIKPKKAKEELPKKEGATKNAKRKGKADTQRDI